MPLLCVIDFETKLAHAQSQFLPVFGNKPYAFNFAGCQAPVFHACYHVPLFRTGRRSGPPVQIKHLKPRFKKPNYKLSLWTFTFRHSPAVYNSIPFSFSRAIPSPGSGSDISVPGGSSIVLSEG